MHVLRVKAAVVAAIASLAIGAMAAPASASAAEAQSAVAPASAAALGWEFYSHFSSLSDCQSRGIWLVQQGFYDGWRCYREPHSFDLWVLS